jgi:RNA polymerase sigma-70 factor (ECF subfamily)
LGHEEREEDFRRAAVAHLDGLFGFALALCHDRTTAEDLVQETYARAFAAAHKPPLEENLRGWLFTILVNVWKNERKRRRPEAVADVERVAGATASPPFSPVLDPLQAVDRRELRDRLRSAIEALPDAFREVVVLRCVEGFSYQEVAGIVGCPAGTVMSRLARARALLRRAIAPNGTQVAEPTGAAGRPNGMPATRDTHATGPSPAPGPARPTEGGSR